MLWFCGQGGNILRIFRGWTGSGPTPPRSACQRSASGTCHLRNVFILAQSLAGFPPHSLRAGRGGQEREGEGHRGEPRGIGNLVPQSMLCKENTPGPAKASCHTACHHPTWLPKPLPPSHRKSHFTPAGRGPGEDIPQTRPPRCGAGSICVQARHRAWLQGCQCESPVRLGTWPANSKPLKSACAFIDHSLKAPATVSPGFPC